MNITIVNRHSLRSYVGLEADGDGLLALVHDLCEVPVEAVELVGELLELDGAVVEGGIVLGVERAPVVDAGLAPVRGQGHLLRQVEVHREEAVVLGIVDVPLFLRS